MSFYSAILGLLLAPAQVHALQDRSVVLTTGIRIAWTQAFSNVVGFLAVTGLGFCTLLFLLGASQLVISHGDQTKVDNGKKTMIGSLVGLSFILGAYAIVRTALFFLYGGTA
jgi:hypothetical protein